ncbi:F-box only protein 5 [Polymixia lowei]
MKCPSSYEAARGNNMEKSCTAAAAEFKVSHLKTSPLKEYTPVKPLFPPVEERATLFSLNNNSRPIHNKENNRQLDRSLDEVLLEDSGYLSLHTSQINDHHDEEDHIQEQSLATPSAPAACQQKTITPARPASARPVSLLTSTPTVRPGKKASTDSLSSTPTTRHSDPNLPILKFQQAVCEELAKGFQRNKRYDWSVVTKLAEDHLLDRVIGGQMGREYVDVFSSLLSRNMKGILTRILSLLGDTDLISCRKVSRTWRRIISEDTAALRRCQRVEQGLSQSRSSSIKENTSGLTRDEALSRVVLSCMQTLASSTPSSSSSSTPSYRADRPASSQRDHAHNSQHTRFRAYLEAASMLKQHESLCSCKRCGSPAKQSSEVQRATCTRSSCLFDFCTRCQEAFHGSSPCRTVLPRPHRHHASKMTPVAGTARSKRNLRRL